MHTLLSHTWYEKDMMAGRKGWHQVPTLVYMIVKSYFCSIGLLVDVLYSQKSLIILKSPPTNFFILSIINHSMLWYCSIQILGQPTVDCICNYLWINIDLYFWSFLFPDTVDNQRSVTLGVLTIKRIFHYSSSFYPSVGL